MGLLPLLVIGSIVGLAGIAIKGRGSGLLGNAGIGAIAAVIGGWVAGLFCVQHPRPDQRFQPYHVHRVCGGSIVTWDMQLRCSRYADPFV